MAVLVAPEGRMTNRRRPLALGHVRVTIQDLLIVIWEMRSHDLNAVLPPTIRPVSSGALSWVSALLFKNRRLRPALLRWPALDSFQMNLRTYVLDPVTGEPASVFFHGLFLSRRWLARLSSAAFGVPFRYLPLEVRVEREAGRVKSWAASSRDGSVRVRAHEEDAHDSVETSRLDLLTNAHTGYVPGRDGRLRAWSIWHPSQRLRTMKVEEASIGSWTEFGLRVGPPSLAFFVESVDYEVYLPARRL